MPKKIKISYELHSRMGAHPPMRNKIIIHNGMCMFASTNPQAIQGMFDGMKQHGKDVELKEGILVQYMKDMDAEEIAEQMEFELKSMRQQSRQHIQIKNYQREDSEDDDKTITI